MKAGRNEIDLLCGVFKLDIWMEDFIVRIFFRLNIVGFFNYIFLESFFCCFKLGYGIL